MRTFASLLATLALLASGVLASVSSHYLLQKEVVDDILNPDAYDPLQIPNPLGRPGQPVVIDVSLHIISVRNIDYNAQSYEITAFLRQTWTDPRLAFNSTREVVDPETNQVTYIELPSIKLHKNAGLWIPDTFVTNGVRHEDMEVSEGDLFSKQFFVGVSPTGVVTYSQMINVVLTNQMVLDFYPYDMVNATIIMESYGYSTDEMLYTNTGEPLTLEQRTINSPAFEIILSPPEYSPGAIVATYATGTFPGFVVQFQFGKIVRKDLLLIVLPVTMLIILNSIIFWLDPVTKLPDRVAVALTCLLTAFAFSFTVELPVLGYLTWAEVFILTSYLFIFASLALSFVEYKRFSRYYKYLDALGNDDTAAASADSSFVTHYVGRAKSETRRRVSSVKKAFSHADDSSATESGSFGSVNASYSTSTSAGSSSSSSSSTAADGGRLSGLGEDVPVPLKRRDSEDLIALKEWGKQQKSAPRSLDRVFRYLYLGGWLLFDFIMLLTGYLVRQAQRAD